MPILNIISVSKRYRNCQALLNINLSLEKGTISGLIGPNGSGKTTLMKIILSHIEYDGKVEFNGSSERDNISISYIPEVINSYEYLTGDQTAKLMYSLQGHNDRDLLRRFCKYSKLLEYNDHSKLIKEHSKGNLRKLFLSYALATSSDIILLDEPFSGLDPMTVENVIDCLAAIRNEKSSCILINTHILDAAKKSCDNLYFIKAGNIINFVEKSMYSDINLKKIFNDNEQ